MDLKDLVILIADDHPMIRKGLIFSLQSIGVGKEFLEADNGEQALQIAASHNIDLYLFDYKMPDMTGIDLTKEILQKKSLSKVMIFSSYAEPNLVLKFYRAGVKGYMEKGCAADELMNALVQVASGKMYYHESLKKIPEPKGKDGKSKIHDPVDFTDSETDLVRMIAGGLSSQEIADAKNLTLKTIETYRTRLFKKADVRNTAELIDYFYRNGLL